MTATTTTTTQDQATIQQNLADLEVLSKQLDILEQVSQVQDLAKQIEETGTPEMKAKLKPFKEHYDGDVVTLIKKRTKQNFDNDIWQAISQKGEAEKAKYRQDPENYFTPEEREEYWQAAYTKTTAEAIKLAKNLEQVLGSAARPTTTQPNPDNTKRRLFKR